VQYKEEIGYQGDPGAVREGGATAMEGERTKVELGPKSVSDERR